MSTEMTTAMGTAFTAISGDVTDVAVIALPVALGIVGLFVAIRLGIKFFKTVTGKA